MLKKVLLAFVLAVAVLAAIVALQPGEYHVERSAAIAAPPAAVFPLIGDFHQWDAWSPWAKLDPAMKLEIAGQPCSAGTTYTWSGNDKAGAGKMTMTECRPNEKVGVDLAFTKPYTSDATLDFTLKPQAEGTAVTWAMTGRSNFMLKAVGLFASMDKMVGPDFEKGLAQLKSAAEGMKR